MTSTGWLCGPLHWERELPVLPMLMPPDRPLAVPRYMTLGSAPHWLAGRARWQVVGPRRCGGVYDHRDGSWSPCPEAITIGESTERPYCRSCIRRSAGAADLVRVRENEENGVLWLAWLAPDLITTIIADDTTDRLLDGGALDATPLARGPIAALRAIKNTGELKGLVADAGDLELQIRSLHNFGPPEDRDAELSTAHTDMSRLNWPDVAVREPYERVHLTPCYGLDQRPLPTSYSWLPQVTPNTLIGGEITHVIGQCLAIQTDVGCVVLPTETLTGWTVLNIE